MSFLSFFWPQVLEKVVSPISGEIKVIEQFGERRLEVGGMTQSGGLVEKIWKEALTSCQADQLSSCLILGLGGGTAAKIISSNCPADQLSSCKLIGVEIDAKIIRLGKKYFGLGEIENLEIVIGDAVKYVSRESGGGRFDLILVDLYQGREIPVKCQSMRFLENLGKIKTKNGLIIFNRLYSRDERQGADEFIKKCRRFFDSVKTSEAVCNLMVWCS